MSTSFTHMEKIGAVSSDGSHFATHRCMPRLLASHTMTRFASLIVRVLKATNHPGPALIDLYHGRKSERLAGTPTMYVRSKATMAALEGSPWFKSASGSLKTSFRVMYADELAPHPWCDDWEVVFFPPHLQLQWFLCAAYAYYGLCTTFISDAVNDSVAHMLRTSHAHWADHNHAQYCPIHALESGGSLHKEYSKFPLIIQHTARTLVEKAEEGLIRCTL